MSKHIHIVGCLPRSGTTLLYELMTNCFEIDGHTEHEWSIFKKYPGHFRVLCTKKPNDIRYIKHPLQINPHLYVIYVLRDPRDAISSRSHKNNNPQKQIWGNLADWARHQQAAESLLKNPRFILIKYEDLAADPDAMQKNLLNRLPFLKIKIPFSDFHKVAKPSLKAAGALGATRPISTSSIGNWRNHLAFVKAQFEKYDKTYSISESLVKYGYEPDSSWLNSLNDIVADNSEEPIKHTSLIRKFWKKYYAIPRKILIYSIKNNPYSCR